MTPRSKLFWLLVFICLALLLPPLDPPEASSRRVKTLVVLPFTVHADRDLGFLQKGLADMLRSRLTWKGKVEVVEPELVDEALKAQGGGKLNREVALAVGNRLGADYVIMGSLTLFGQSLSIDAEILDTAGGKTLMTAFNESRGMDEVIPTISRFAQDINDKILGRKREEPGPVQAGPAREGALVEVEGLGKGPKEPAHVQRFSVELTGLAMADVDGDGRQDLVLIDKDTVFVYTMREGTLVQIQAVKGSWSPQYVYVSAADLNRNGRAELYVSSLTATNVGSFVLEWDGGRMKKLASGEPWFFRVTQIPGKGKLLLGQKRITDGGYLGDVYPLAFSEGSIRPGEALSLPRFANVFNFVQGHLQGQGELLTVLLDPYEHLRVYDKQQEMIWRSDEYFGGTVTYMEDKGKGYLRQAGTGKRIFFPSPIFLNDVDRDGKPEVVICQNSSTTRRLTESMRHFSSGKIHFLQWDGVGLRTRWTSQEVSGPVVGYAIGDLDGDGKPELAMASVTTESYMMGRPKSQVAIYRLQP